MRVPSTVIALAVAGLLSGCGASANPHTSPQTAGSGELALQRAQFVHLSEELRSLEGAVAREVAASRHAWPSIAAGLPRTPTDGLQRGVGAALAAAVALVEPPFMANASRLTGPAAGIAGLYESYERLTERGWRLVQAAIGSIRAGTSVAASFERNNSPLYIDSVYDGHFNLSLLGEHLLSGYQQLGGSEAFGARLTQGELRSLASAYSVAAVRLSPHPSGVATEG